MTQTTGPHVVGFMDIGTNSVRLLVVRIAADHTVTTLTEQKEVVRLGEGEFGAQRLQPEAMSRAALVCRRFAELARTRGAAAIVAVATAAAREAKNQREFLRLLRQEAGVDVHVVSGAEEARLIYLGVSAGTDLEGKKALFIDIGGGSTEVVVGDQQRYTFLDTLRLGAVRLTSLFFVPGETEPVPASRYALLQRYVRSHAVRATHAIRERHPELAVGSSGTITNLADVAMHHFCKRRRQRDDVLKLSQLERVVKLLCSLPLEERRQVPGINPERADIIVAGAAILHTLLEDCGLSEIRISDRGLRDGLVLDYLARSAGASGLEELPVQERSVLQLGRACRFDEEHARRVADLALELFDSGAAAGLHKLGERERRLLRYAALLHDIGTFVSYENHHAHTYYLIRNAELLGFDDTEIAIIAATALFHRKTFPGKNRPELTSLDPASGKVVRILSVLLRLAESLDRGHAGAVRQVAFRALNQQSVALRITPARDCQLEMWGVHAQEEAFERVFRRKLIVEEEPAG